MNAPRVDPRTGQINFPPLPPGVPLGPRPMVPGVRYFRVRRGLGGVSDNLNTVGAAGGLIATYNENNVFNPPRLTGGAVYPSGQPASTLSVNATSSSSSDGSGVVSSTGETLPSAMPGNYLPSSTPFGQNERRWSNPTTFATVPINGSTSPTIPSLQQNFQRNALIIQNASTATAPDVAPTFYVGFNAEPVVGLALFLLPGVGIFFDIICPRDAIYIALGPFSGGSVVIGGAVVTGTYAP